MFGFKKKSFLKIRTIGDPVLKKRAAVIENVDNEVKALAVAMVETMFEDDGIGLAAPQVGESIRMIALGVPSAKNPETLGPQSPGEIMLLPRMPLVLVNPEIISHGSDTDIAEEGCLSVPEIYAQVERYIQITITTQILGGEKLTIDCGGFLSRVLQHEIDHLDGKLFVDRLTSEEREKIKGKVARLKKQGKKQGYIKSIKG